MLWKDLLQTEEQPLVAPWVGGRSLCTDARAFVIDGALPPEHGWHTFGFTGRRARWIGVAARGDLALRDRVRGYLVGDRLVPERVQVCPKLEELTRRLERVHLIEPGLDRFARVVAGRFYEGGPLIFDAVELPLGPEADVLEAFLDGADSADHVPGVSPALDAVFRIEVWRRREAERRRREHAERLRLERVRQEQERMRREILETLGDAATRRAVASYDFAEAARAALALGGAEYLDHRPGYHADEMVVRFRYDGRRFECSCDRWTLRIIDAGICLVDHATGERGDTWFTLESLPAVIRQADREGVLVVLRGEY